MQARAHFGQDTEWAGHADEALYDNELSDTNEDSKGIGGDTYANYGAGNGNEEIWWSLTCLLC